MELLTEHYLECLSLKGACTGSSESCPNVTLLEITCHGSYYDCNNVNLEHCVTYMIHTSYHVYS